MMSLETILWKRGIALVNYIAGKSSCNSFGNKNNAYNDEYDEGHECDESSTDTFGKYAV